MLQTYTAKYTCFDGGYMGQLIDETNPTRNSD